jgi:hypothetical protein
MRVISLHLPHGDKENNGDKDARYHPNDCDIDRNKRHEQERHKNVLEQERYKRGAPTANEENGRGGKNQTEKDDRTR